MSSVIPTTPRSKAVRILAAIAIAIVGVFVIAFATHPAEKDFISYWSAGKLLLQHADPYSYNAVFALEQSQGYSELRPLIMRNPPWALFLVAPLGFGSPLTGFLLWTIVSLACILAFLRLLHVPADDALLAFLFAPALATLCAGQSSPFLLLGFVLFLYLHQRHPFAAGCSLLLLAIKPHLFFIFWVILLLDCIHRRSMKILAGLAVALACATGFTLLFDPQIWPHYFSMLQHAAIQNEFLPTLSELFRLGVNVNSSWLVFVPTLIALAWAVRYFIKKRDHWDWDRDSMLLMLVALLTSPYCWVSDQTVLLPVIAYALMLTPRRRFSVEILLVLNCSVLFIVLVLRSPLTSIGYIWTPAAWLFWFLYATWPATWSPRPTTALAA
jgi:hypothetical protein